jgi:hypothetical protein
VPWPALCIAVGSGVNGLAVAERWDGTAWSVVPTPNPPGAVVSSLNGVSCSSATACTAVGTYQTQEVFAPLVERWNGIAWRVQPSPRPAGRLLSPLAAVSCAATNACTAVGCHFDGNIGCLASLAEEWDGAAWRIRSTPPTVLSLNGVSCTSASTCMAVGIGDNNGRRATLAERWNGSTWTVVPSPNPNGGQLVKLFGVSCPTTVCIAVGSYADRLGDVVTLAERWDGAKWRIHPTANPRGGEIILSGVACRAATACTAVGNYQTGTGTTFTLAERWNGATWTIQPTPNPQGGIVEGIFGVSCSATSACTAVGNNFFNQSGDSRSLAERWNGRAWTIQATP